MIVGDTHGNTKSFLNVLKEAGDRKITHVFVVGDFGLWTHEFGGHKFLDDINRYCIERDVHVFAIGGNHENWDHWNWYVKNNPTSKGFAYVRSHVLIAPKIHTFTLAGKRFAVAGGAVSIDRDYRVARERGGRFDDGFGSLDVGRGTGPRTLWWPDEELTDQDVVKIQQTFGTADYLLTHDCSNFTHFRHRLKPDSASERHRHRIDKVIASVKPKVHFHGHMHTRYEWENTLSHGDSAFRNEPWTGPVTKTYGLECDGDYYNWGVFETDTGDFAFRGEGMQFRSLENSDLED